MREKRDLRHTWGKMAAALALVLVLLAGLIMIPGLPGVRAEGELPDLEIEEISLPAVLQAGQAASVTAEVYNKGGGEAAGFTVTLYAGDTEVASKTVASTVYGGNRETVSFTWTPAVAGTVLLKAVADSGGTVAESRENNNELTKEVTVGAAPGPLALVGASPVNKGTIKTDDEISLTFNKPVKIASNTLALYYNDNTKNQYTPGTSLGSKKDVMQVDPDNPCKVILNINQFFLDPGINRLYAVQIASNAFQAADTGEKLSLFNTAATRWNFNTGPVPKSVTLEAPARLEVGKTGRIAATVTDTENRVIKGCTFTWEAADPTVASIDDKGNVTGLKTGKTAITATLSNFTGYSRSGTAQVEIREKLPLTLSSLWRHEIPLSYQADGQDYIPVAAKDGSVYFMIAYHGLGEKSGVSSIYKLRALDPDGTPKGGFLEPVITVQPVLGEIQGEEYIFTARDRTFLALDPASGAVRWQRELESEVRTPAAVGRDGSVYVACADCRVYALHPDVEGCRWKYDAEGQTLGFESGTQAYGAFTVDEQGRVYIVAGTTLRVVDGATGALCWMYTASNNEPIKNQAALAPDGTVLIGADDLKDSDPGRLYALTPPAQAGGTPVEKWSKEFDKLWMLRGQTPVDGEGNIYAVLKETPDIDSVFAKISTADGAILSRSSFTGIVYGRWGAGGRLYTNRVIFDPQGQPEAYYDEYYGNLSYFYYSSFTLGEDGTIYRLWVSEGRVVAVEAACLYDPAGSVPARLELDQDSLILNNGGSERLYPRVLDQNGVIMTTEELDWSSSDEELVRVENGLLTASDAKTGTAEITVSLRFHPEIALTISVEVKTVPVPAKMYFVNYTSGVAWNTAAEAAPFLLDRITGAKGEWLTPVSVFVEDQHGNLIRNEPVLFELADGETAVMLTEAGLGKSVRYGARLTGQKEGSTTLTARLQNYPDIACTVPVEVLPAPYDILWTVPLEGGWWQKWGWHTMGADGKIFYVNNNALKAVDKKDGSAQWTADVGDRYGISLSTPQTGPDGTVYVFSTTNTVVVAVRPEDGRVKWKFAAGSDPVQELQLGETAAYALTEGGKLYQLDLEGKPVWNAPLDLGRDNGGMVLASGGSLYTVHGGALWEVQGQKEETKLYQGAAEDVLTLKAAAPQGDLILQQARAGAYSLVSLDAGGSVQWTREIPGPVEVSCGADGTVYAITPYVGGKNMDVRFYVVNREGTIISDGLLLTGTGFETNDTDMFTPVPGKNGVVYFAVDRRIYAVDGAAGRVLRSIQIKDEYNAYMPRTLTVDEEGILYGTFGDMGLIAIAEKVYYGDRVRLSLAGKERLRAGSLGELRVKVENDLEEDKEVLLRVALTGPESETAGFFTVHARLEAQKEQEFSLGIRVPPDGGNWGVVVSVFDARTQELYGSFSEAAGR